jgi:hypothetical protein
MCQGETSAPRICRMTISVRCPRVFAALGYVRMGEEALRLETLARALGINIDVNLMNRLVFGKLNVFYFTRCC